MNKSHLLGALSAYVLIFLSTAASAELIDNGDGLIYDTVLDITWSQPDIIRTWDDANTWAEGLMLGGVSGWRLPYISVAAGSEPINAPSAACQSTELACRDNELGYMFYYNLSGTYGNSILTSGDPDLALFPSLQDSYPYWSRNVGPVGWLNFQSAWSFYFFSGTQDDYSPGVDSIYSWAVHNGNVTGDPVPYISVADTAGNADDLQVPFGIVTEMTQEDHVVTIKNMALTDLMIGQIAVNDPLAAPFSIHSDNCSAATLPFNSTCTFMIGFSPPSLDPFIDTFDIPSNDPDDNPLTISVSGEGVNKHFLHGSANGYLKGGLKAKKCGKEKYIDMASSFSINDNGTWSLTMPEIVLSGSYTELKTGKSASLNLNQVALAELIDYFETRTNKHCRRAYPLFAFSDFTVNAISVKLNKKKTQIKVKLKMAGSLTDGNTVRNMKYKLSGKLNYSPN